MTVRQGGVCREPPKTLSRVLLSGELDLRGLAWGRAARRVVVRAARRDRRRRRRSAETSWRLWNPSVVDETVYTDAGTSGTTFKWDATAQRNLYNWSTKGVPVGYYERIGVTLDDGQTYNLNIGLRRGRPPALPTAAPPRPRRTARPSGPFA
jgi:hypothetical protein